MLGSEVRSKDEYKTAQAFGWLEGQRADARPVRHGASLESLFQLPRLRVLCSTRQRSGRGSFRECETPFEAMAQIKEYVTFYPARVDESRVTEAGAPGVSGLIGCLP
jgi:hypothetical protein